jgi:WD40 repeat protein
MLARTFLLPVAVGLCGSTAIMTWAATAKIEQQIVGPAWVQGTIFTQSPKGSRIASTYAKDGKWIVAIDNVEGEAFDDILKTATRVEPEFNEADIVTGQSIPPPGPVAFSHDGKRYAYAGRRGEDVVVILDGMEIFRSRHSQAAPPVSLLQFSPNGQHLFFYNQTADTLQTSFRLMMDGKPVTPSFDRTPPLFFSPDGSRWILNGAKAKAPQEKLLVIDGKEAGYTAERARFSPDGKHVVCTTPGRGEQKLLVDGKVVLDTKATIERFRISATGDIAVITQKSSVDQNQLLYLNGKLVPAVEGVRDIVFSPDGKHWAARCSREMHSIMWVVVDGKKHQEYKSIGSIQFSPDSSKCVYVAESGSKKFLVTNGEEDSGNAVMRGLAFGKTGNKFVYGAGPNTLMIHHDGKTSPPHPNVFKLEISPDGNRIAYFVPTSPTSADFIVDGEVKGGGGAFGDKVVFSPDSRHIAANARPPKEGTSVYIDGQFLPPRRSLGVPMEFTPDSQHLIVQGNAANDPSLNLPGQGYYLDGQLVASFAPRGVTWANSPTRVRQAVGALPWGASSAKLNADAKDWEFQDGGKIVFVGVAHAPAGFGPMTRITVTPAPGTSFNTWFDDVRAAEERETADALAAKEKAAADKAAASEKAKAAAAEAAAKRKADLEAAAAAKAKARADAAAAKKAKTGR